MLPAARVTDLIVSVATQSIPIPIMPPGAMTVLIEGFPAARVTDTCGVDAIIHGSATVLINGLPAARVTDLTASGGAITAVGAQSVFIGS